MPSYRRLPELLERLDRVAPGRPVIITEFGWTTSPSPYRASHVSEDEQARFIAQAVRRMSAEPRIVGAIAFNLENNPGWPSGLWRFRAGAKPSRDAFRALVARAERARG